MVPFVIRQESTASAERPHPAGLVATRRLGTKAREILSALSHNVLYYV